MNDELTKQEMFQPMYDYIPKRFWDSLMFVRIREGKIHSYKHDISKRYINVDKNGQFYLFVGEYDEQFERIPRSFAINQLKLTNEIVDCYISEDGESISIEKLVGNKIYIEHNKDYKEIFKKYAGERLKLKISVLDKDGDDIFIDENNTAINQLSELSKNSLLEIYNECLAYVSNRRFNLDYLERVYNTYIKNMKVKEFNIVKGYGQCIWYLLDILHEELLQRQRQQLKTHENLLKERILESLNIEKAKINLLNNVIAINDIQLDKFLVFLSYKQIFNLIEKEIIRFDKKDMTYASIELLKKQILESRFSSNIVGINLLMFYMSNDYIYNPITNTLIFEEQITLIKGIDLLLAIYSIIEDDSEFSGTIPCVILTHFNKNIDKQEKEKLENGYIKEW